MHRVLGFTLMALLASSFCSCAAMFTGMSEEVTFTSSPSGATVRVGDLEGTTPVTLTVSKSTDEVSFSHPQYGERKGEIDSSFMGGFLLMDLLFTPGFGSVGLLVDGFTFAWWDPPGIVHYDFNVPDLCKGFVPSEPSGAGGKKVHP